MKIPNCFIKECPDDSTFFTYYLMNHVFNENVYKWNDKVKNKLLFKIGNRMRHIIIPIIEENEKKVE